MLSQPPTIHFDSTQRIEQIKNSLNKMHEFTGGRIFCRIYT